MKKYITAILLSVCISYIAPAQSVTNAFNLNYTPPSPNAAALGKFGEYPVSLSSGVPSISVPLFNYKGVNSGLSLAVSLDYHAGGVRVEETASNVGMGWALNAGGVISRTVRSLPDDAPVYGYLANYPLPPPYFTAGSTNIALNNCLNNAVDYEQDEFNFNFNGHSGRFMLNATGTPSLITQEAIKIQALRSPGVSGLPFTGFIITDENGIKYVFQDAETSISKMGSYVSIVHYTSSWYITSIINPSTRDTIKFSYNTATNNIYNVGSETSQNLGNAQIGVSLNTVYLTSSGTSTSHVVKRIKSIKLPDNTEFNFLYNPISRCDLKHDSTLAEVRQKNSLTGQYKSFKLYQSYISNFGIISTYASAPCDLNDNLNATNLRLRLDSVKETGGAISAKPYKFSYNDNYFLPATDSKNQDFWGFYNGSINTTGHLVPQMLYTDFSRTYMLPGADRRVDSDAVSAGILTKVAYPTGGYSQFDFETNRAGNNKLIFNSVGTNYIIFGDSNGTPDNSKVFTINRQPNNQTLNIKFILRSWCPQTAVTCSFIFKIKSIDNATTYTTVQFAHSEIGTTKTAPLNLPNGQYQLTWQFDSASACTCMDEFGYSVFYDTIIADSTQLGGGIRIKKITNYDGVNHANDVVKQYKYLDSQGKSSGYAAVLPTFSYATINCRIEHQGTGMIGDPTIYTEDPYLNRTATTNYPLTYSNGGINYARVEVDEIGPVNNGKEINYFTSYKDSPPQSNGGSAFTFPFVPLQTLSWKIGLLTQQEIYNSAGQMLKKTSNAYNFMGDFADTLANYKVGTIRNACDAGSAPPQYSINSYYLFYGYSNKKQVTNVDYTAAGDSVVTRTSYTYDPNYFTLSKEVSTGSKNDSVATYHYYPFNYNISGSVFSAMRDSNIIAKPVSNEIWRYLSNKYYLVSADATNYALYNNSYLPSKYYYLKSTVPVDPATIGVFSPTALLRVPALYDQKINFSSYDIRSNPILINQRGLRTAYIWDINMQFPIAKISNADSLSAAYTSFESDGTGNWTIASSVRDGVTVAFTGSKSYVLSNGGISKTGLTSTKTYVVAYWRKNGTALSIAGTIAGYPITGATRNGWTYYEHRITGQTSVSISGTGNIDELRLYPVDAQMTTYTYDPLLGVTSSTDAKGETTYYEYDALQRLINVRDKDMNIIKHTDYHYAGQ
jgi:YD repeat-containing protein